MPHVALLIETTRSYGRAMLRGVHRYISEHGPWSVYLELRSLDSKAPPWLKHWRGDGILSRTYSQATADIIRDAGVPAVELRATRLKHSLPFIGVDNRALGRMVAEHLLERGFRQFGVYQLGTEDYFEQRRDNFVETIQEAGFSVDVFNPLGSREQPLEWERQQAGLAKWVTRLPKPVGIMACTDQLGFWLLDACQRAGVAVPEQAAVVGAENDETLCTMSLPPLSSVQFNGERIGYEAAALLARLMAGKPAPLEHLLVEPLHIVTRQSSDIIALDDVEVAAAVRYIRLHACDGIGVKHVLNAVPISRSALERRMRRMLGRTPKEEIARVQIERVRQLLVETDLSLSGVAAACGFPYPQYMGTLFKQYFDCTPGQYRARQRV